MVDFNAPVQSIDQEPSQWQSILQNLGAWQGSFTRLSPHGLIQDDIPTLVTLEGLNDHQTIRQTIQQFSSTSGEVVQTQVLEYASLNRSILVFPNGAFSQGSIQFGPFSEFGAELGFIEGDRRLRLVPLFDTHSQLSSFTLIREHRQQTPPAERPTLTVEQLQGTWQGEAITLYTDWQPPSRYSTRLSIQVEGDRLQQCLTTPQFTLTSTAQIDGSILRFEPDSSNPTKPTMQVLLLPDGASANTPLAIPRGQPFLLEAGWLIEPTLRQRLIRRYDDKGGWQSLTLVTERKQG